MKYNNDITPKRIALRLADVTDLRIMLVYQAGIANVFRVAVFNLAADAGGLADGDRQAQRIYQGDFRTAESICYGMGLAGAIVRSAACNRAGDIAGQTWTEDLDAQPFSDKFCPQVWNGGFGEQARKDGTR